MNITTSGTPTITVAWAEYAGSIVARFMFCHSLRLNSALSAKWNQRGKGKRV
jgi:hypothetical protein